MGLYVVDNIEEIVSKIGLENKITLDEIPEIDLYMDQVIQLFENKFVDSKRNKDEKILTKTMINNYAKGNLFIPIKNKKYSKEHLILISLIYQLKGTLSISDIKLTMEGLNQRITEGNVNLGQFYNSYLELLTKNVEKVKEDVTDRVKEVEEEIIKQGNEQSDYLKQILLVASLINISNSYRRIAEKIIDEIGVSKDSKHE